MFCGMSGLFVIGITLSLLAPEIVFDLLISASILFCKSALASFFFVVVLIVLKGGFIQGRAWEKRGEQGRAGEMRGEEGR